MKHYDTTPEQVEEAAKELGTTTYIAHALLERGLTTNELKALNADRLFEEFCEWHGLSGWASTLVSVLDKCRKMEAGAPTPDTASPLGNTPIEKDPTPMAGNGQLKPSTERALDVLTGGVDEGRNTDHQGKPSAPLKESAHNLFRTLHETLRGYERHHLAKVPPRQDQLAANVSPESAAAAKFAIDEIMAKVRRNGDLASRIERWLEANPMLHVVHSDNARRAVFAAYEAGTGELPDMDNEQVREKVDAVCEMVNAMLVPALGIYDPDTQMVDTYDAGLAKLAVRIAMPLLQNAHDAYAALEPMDGETKQ